MRKRVVFLSPFVSTGGGAERVLLDHIRFLDRERFEPFAAVVGPGSFAEAARALGVETYVSEPHSEARPLTMAKEMFRFGNFVRRNRIDVVVGNKYRAILYWGLTSARRARFVWLLHDPPIEHGFWRRLAAQLVGRLQPSWTVWVTPESSEAYGSRFPHLEAANSSEIRPGTCAEDLQQDADAARARVRWGVPDGAPVLSLFARMQPSKGHLDLIRAAPQILAEFPDTHFLLCGGTVAGMPPEHEAAVRAAISSGGLEKRVLVLGMISEQEKRDVLAASTLLVHPADWEPFGIAVIEGMAVGKPVVVADARGPSLIVDHDETGLIVPKNQPPALAEAILALLRDPARAARLGKLGAQRVAERYHSRVAARKLGEIIDAIA